LQNGTDALTSMRNCKTLDLRFRALVTGCGTKQLELAGGVGTAYIA
jgi:hypothetical protein